MTDYETGLLGQVYCLRLKVTGLRPFRSPAASAAGKPEPKRVRGHESSDGVPSEVSIRDSTLEDMSLRTPSAQAMSSQDAVSPGHPTSDSVPNIVGVTDDLSLGATSGSRNSSTDSSFGHSATSHIPFAGHGQMVMSARDPTGLSSETGAISFHVTRQFIPGTAVKPIREVAIPAESVVSTRTSKTHASRKSRRHSDWVSSSESDSSDDGYHQSRRSHGRRRSSRRDPRDKSPSRYSDRFRRSYRSGKSGRSSVSVRYGLAEVAVNALHQVQKLNEMVQKLDEKISNPVMTVPDAEVLQKLEEAARTVRDSEQRAQEAERRLYEASVQAAQMAQAAQAAQTGEVPDVEAIVQAA
jgi:hypothetical protein